MQFQQAFPIVIIDDAFEGHHAAGRAVQQLAVALEGLGFRVESGFWYEDARRLTRVYHNESCLLISLGGGEASNGHRRWRALQALLTTTRQRNTRLPIFLLGDERTAEGVPSDLLKHIQAFLRLHEASPAFLARAIARSAHLYLETLLPPMFKALADYTQRASGAWHTPGNGGGVAFRQSPVGRVFYDFFGENTLRADIPVSVGELGSSLDHSGPIGEGERNAARIFGADHTLFVANGASAASKIIWQGLVGRGDLVLCDRNCHTSILHAIIMTGAVPIYLRPSRNRLGMIGPISRDQFTAGSIHQKIADNPFAGETSGHVRLMMLTNSTHDGLCYNVDAIKDTLGDSVDILHFDEGWFAYANFHEFYAGHHGISSDRPRRSRHALTCATQSTHKLLAAFSQASLIHLLDSESSRLDMARFNEAFMMHSSTSPQYGILASCDVAAAMMEQPGGRALVQEMLDEAVAFRRAMAGVKREPGGGWWFEVWQPPAMAEHPVADRAQWLLDADDRWHGFEHLAPQHVLLDPSKVTLLTPGLRADGRMAPHGIPASIVTSFLSSRRIEIQRTGLYSFLVLFSMGVSKGRRSTLLTELLEFRDFYNRNAPVGDVLPALAGAYPDEYGSIGLRDLCEKMHARYWTAGTARAQQEMYTVLPEMALRPGDAYERLVRGRVESVEIDHLMGRMLAVMLVPSPPGIPLVMPGERLTQSTAAIQNYLLNARSFDAAFPGFETDIHGLRFEPAKSGRRYLVDCVRD